MAGKNNKRSKGAGGTSSGATVQAAKPAVGHLQNPEDRKIRLTQAEFRGDYAKFLKSTPKPVRRAIRVARIAQRDWRAGEASVMGKAGSGKRSNSSSIANIAEGRIRLQADFGKRKGKMTDGERQATYRTMINSGNVLRGRQRIRAVGARVRGMGGARRTTTAAKPKGVLTRAVS